MPPRMLGQCPRCLLDQRLERSRLAHGKLGQDLAVDLDPGFAEAADKSAVGQAMLAHGGVDALDPQGSERPLAVLAIAIGVLRRLVDRRLGGADGVLAPAVEALGAMQNFLVLGVRGDAAFYSRHEKSPGKGLGRSVSRSARSIS